MILQLIYNFSHSACMSGTCDHKIISKISAWIVACVPLHLKFHLPIGQYIDQLVSFLFSFTQRMVVRTLFHSLPFVFIKLHIKLMPEFLDTLIRCIEDKDRKIWSLLFKMLCNWRISFNISNTFSDNLTFMLIVYIGLGDSAFGTSDCCVPITGLR